MLCAYSVAQSLSLSFVYRHSGVKVPFFPSLIASGEWKVEGGEWSRAMAQSGERAPPQCSKCSDSGEKRTLIQSICIAIQCSCFQWHSFCALFSYLLESLSLSLSFPLCLFLLIILHHLSLPLSLSPSPSHSHHSSYPASSSLSPSFLPSSCPNHSLSRSSPLALN